MNTFMDNGVLKLGCSRDPAQTLSWGVFLWHFMVWEILITISLLRLGEASVGDGNDMQIVEEFRRVAGDIKIIDRPEEKEMYSHDIGDVPAFMTKMLFKTQPSFIVQPKNVAEIQKVLAFANEKKIPVIARGAASWGFGGVVPTKGGIVVDLSPFRKIIAINPEQQTARVEAGARWSDIDIMAKSRGCH
jgi:FAD/FMN-containing dehydrogenase